MISSSRSVVLCSLVAGLLACSKGEPAATTQASSTVASSTLSATVAPPPAVPAPTPAPASATAPAEAAAQATATPNSLANADGEKPGLRVDITELKRSSGGTVMMKFVLTNNSKEKLSLCCHWLGDSAFGNPDYSSVGAVHLIDPVGKKKYFVIRDVDHQCICSRDIATVPAGEKTNLWAKFPAPPPDVQKVSIVVPHFTPMDDVAIQ